MTKPSVTPESICLKLRPGEFHSTIVTLNAPTKGIVTASVVNGGSLVSLKEIVASKLIRRDPTPLEIAELPARPPSIREKALASGVEELQESGRSDGTGSSTLNRGHEHHRSIRRCSACEGRPRRFGGAQRGNGT